MELSHETKADVYRQLEEERLVVIHPDVGEQMRANHWRRIDELLDTLGVQIEEVVPDM
jgi:hypothetical protein